MKHTFNKSATRSIAVILSVIMIFSLIPFTVSASTYAAGTKLKVTFLMPETDYISGIEGKITYGDTLEYIDNSITSPHITDATVNTANKGVIGFNATNIDSYYDMSSDHILFTATFKTLNDVDTLALVCTVEDAYYLDASYAFIDTSTAVQMEVEVVAAESTEPSTGVTEPSTDAPKPTETEATEPSTNVPDPTDTTPTESTQPSETAGTTPTESTQPTEPTEIQKPTTAPNAGPGADADKAEDVILDSKKDTDPKGSSFGALSAKQKKVKKNAITISWNKVKGATKYQVYGAKCGSSYKKLKTLRKVKFTQKKLQKGTYYKYLVMAVDADNKVVSTSKTLHIATLGSKKKANPTGVKTAAKNDQVSIKIKKKFKLKGANVVAKKTTVKKHRTIKYEISNAKIATVSKQGVIKGKKVGTCYVYAYAQNGLYKKIKVTVK